MMGWKLSTTARARALVVGAVAGLSLAACGQKPAVEATPPTPAAETVREIEQGAVVGFVGEADAHVWLGVPFAASTAGENRWRAPRPAPAFEGRFEALEMADPCPQISNVFTANGGETGVLVGSEDCLSLDVYAPPNAVGKSLPVMMWIHGGGNVWGRSGDYVGAQLAQNEDVIVVAVQYRMGPLGWFAHPAIRESAETAEDAGANFGTLDLIAALKWINANIEVFGGDPGNVTVFGESAGGRNTVTLLASPLAKGLFHRAIVQSGGFDSTPLADAEGRGAAIDNASDDVAERLGAQTAGALRAVSVDDLYTAYDTGGEALFEFPQIIEDGVVLPAGPLRDAFASPDGFNAMPVITGANRDEMKLFNAVDPDFVRRIFNVFIMPKDGDFYDAASDYASRVWRVRAVDEPAAIMSAGGHEAVWAYRFDWDEGGRFLVTDTSELLGASHAMEIPFVFNRFIFFGSLDPLVFNKKNAAGRLELARIMGAYWASFARDGVPVATAAPDWPVFSENGASLMRFDSFNDGGVGVMVGADTIEQIAADLKVDSRLNDAERCRIVGDILRWTPSLAPSFSAIDGC